MLKLKSSLISARPRYFFIILCLLLAFAAFVYLKKQKILSTAVGHIKAGQIIDVLPVYDCGVVLTGAPGRLREAFEILAQKKLAKLIVSGVYRDAQLHEIFPQLPYYPEVRAESIILEKLSGSTIENAGESLTVVRSQGCRSVLLITSDLHMNRARRIFNSVYPAEIKIETYAVSSVKSWVDIYYETLKAIWYDAYSLIFRNSPRSS